MNGRERNNNKAGNYINGNSELYDNYLNNSNDASSSNGFLTPKLIKDSILENSDISSSNNLSSSRSNGRSSPRSNGFSSPRSNGFSSPRSNGRSSETSNVRPFLGDLNTSPLSNNRSSPKPNLRPSETSNVMRDDGDDFITKRELMELLYDFNEKQITRAKNEIINALLGTLNGR